MGVILFGAWSLIKFAVTFLIHGVQFEGEYDENIIFISTIIVWVVLGLAFLIRLYIGLSARAESEGRRRRRAYLILTGLIAFIDAAAIVVEIIVMVMEPKGLLNMAITVMIDVTSTVILIELLVNAVRIRRIRREAAA